MTERLYFSFSGFILLAALYIDSDIVIYSLASVMLLESIFDTYLSGFTHALHSRPSDKELFSVSGVAKYKIKAKRIWRIVVSLAFVFPYAMSSIFDNDMLWYLPWFMGFSIIGAGLSGFCPIHLFITKMGFSQ